MGVFSIWFRFFLAMVVILSFSGCAVKKTPIGAQRFSFGDFQFLRLLSIGPFQSAFRENSIDHLQSKGGEKKLRPDPGDSVWSTLCPQGVCEWQELALDELRDDYKTVPFNEELWSTLSANYGHRGALQVSYVYGEFESQQGGPVKILAENASEFVLNGRRYSGDPYQRGYQIPAYVRKGLNRILLKIPGLYRSRFDLKIERTESSLIAIGDHTVPDLLRDQDQREIWVSYAVGNSSDRFLKQIEIRVKNSDYFEADQKVFSGGLAPFAIRKFPLLLRRTSRPLPEDLKKVRVGLEILSPGAVTIKRSLEIPIKSTREAHNVSFLSSLDNSVQYFAVRHPIDALTPDKKYSLILGLHGANVKASFGVRTYSPKNEAFVIAPTNRRRYGFAYHGLGGFDVLEVLEESKKRYPIDSRRVILTGHSMGGQGVFAVGLKHPYLFQGLAPAASWTYFRRYIPTFFQRSQSFAPPEKLFARHRSEFFENNLYFLENAKHLPLSLLTATEDPVVGAFHSRHVFKRAKELDLKTELFEIESDEHWCQKPKVNQTGYRCVDDPRLFEFIENNSNLKIPTTLSFITYDLSLSNQSYWLKILQQEERFKVTRAEAKWDEDQKELHLKTKNVSALKIQAPAAWEVGERFSVIWNKKDYLLSRSDPILLKNPESSLSPSLSWPRLLSEKKVIVVGTDETGQALDYLLQEATLYANRHWLSSNADIPIILDTEFDRDQFKDYHWLLFGDFQNNRVKSSLKDRLPFDPSSRASKDYGLIYLYPREIKDSESQFVGLFTGTSKKAQSWFHVFSIFAKRAGASMPDYIFFDEKVRRDAWGGVFKSGYFKSDWSVPETNGKLP